MKLTLIDNELARSKDGTIYKKTGTRWELANNIFKKFDENVPGGSIFLVPRPKEDE